MRSNPDSYEIRLTRHAASLSVAGVLNRDNAQQLCDWVAGEDNVARLELSELELDDGLAAVAAVNAVRELMERVDHLVLDNAPQLLTHNLYRCGLLGSGRIELVAPREEEPYG